MLHKSESNISVFDYFYSGETVTKISFEILGKWRLPLILNIFISSPLCVSSTSKFYVFV